MRDGKTLWIILSPKDGGTVQANRNRNPNPNPNPNPNLHRVHTTHIPGTYHDARTVQVLTEDMDLAGEVLQDLCTFLQDLTLALTLTGPNPNPNPSPNRS